MKRIELLAPAGDLDKLKLALTYGADAVYIGGKSYSLRYFASNFTLDDIKEGVIFAHNLNKKVYVACNMVMHEENTEGILEYLKALKEINVDAVIISSLYILQLAKSINLEAHMSTQLSVLNIEAVNFFYNNGSSRVVLGREANINEIKAICENSKAEIEVFIHGGMCSSYSGKCLLSLEMSDRDPNRGGCAYSCRWKYIPYVNNEKMYEDDTYISLSSKDLSLMKEIPLLIDAGVASLKIEGRMKSYNYLAVVISIYRKIIDDYYEHKITNIDEYLSLLSLGENRQTGHGFIYGNVTKDEMLLEINDRFAKPGEFIAVVRDYQKETGRAYIEVRNKILANNDYLLISPYQNLSTIHITKMYYKGQEIDSHTIANNIIEIEVDKPLHPYELIHIKK